MNPTPEVWEGALVLLSQQMPDFAFEAWIAPLAVKSAQGRLLLACEHAFHRDRVRILYLSKIVDAVAKAGGAAKPSEAEGSGLEVELILAPEWERAPGRIIEVDLARVQERARLGVERMQPVAVAATAERGERLAASPATEPRTRFSEGSAPSGKPDATAEIRQDPPTDPLPESPPRFELRIGKLGRTPEALRPARTTREGGQAVQQELPFSFDSFVVGACNSLAREAALALARARQKNLNLLYLVGGPGLGKTHLARAAAREARLHGLRTSQADVAAASTAAGPRGAGSQIVFTSAEKFTTEFVSAMRNGDAEAFKRRHRRGVSMLVVEDVQFFTGRAQTQQELYHTVQHVIDSGGRVLLTGDRAPSDLHGLDSRIRDQLGSGFVAELEPPDALVRRHILRTKAAAGGVRLPDSCLDLLVEASSGSVRDVEGLLIQVVTTASLLGQPVDLELTREAIARKQSAQRSVSPKQIEVQEITRIVASFFGTRPETLASKSRRRDVLLPRQFAMYLAHRYTDASFAEIGRAFGRRHPSVRNAIERIERQTLENAPLRYKVEALVERIEEAIGDRD